jgi:hypothetical protein
MSANAIFLTHQKVQSLYSNSRARPATCTYQRICGSRLRMCHVKPRSSPLFSRGLLIVCTSHDTVIFLVWLCCLNGNDRGLCFAGCLVSGVFCLVYFGVSSTSPFHIGESSTLLHIRGAGPIYEDGSGRWHYVTLVHGAGDCRSHVVHLVALQTWTMSLHHVHGPLMFCRSCNAFQEDLGTL